MKAKKTIRRLTWTFVVLFILMNVVAFIHAWKFTHFDSSQLKTKEVSDLSFGEKFGLIISGINNPRTKNTISPDTTFETIHLKSNKEIECWMIRTKDAKGAVVLFHGYGGKKSSMLDKANIFRKLGYNTLLVDFMGAGGSEGNQTTIGFKEAEEVKSCYDYLKANGESTIVLFGTSLGAAAILKAINDYSLPVSSIIIECPFSTMLQTVKNRFTKMGIPSFPMAQLLVFWGGVQNGFNAFSHNPVVYAANINCPTLLLYGEKDEKVSKKEITSIFNKLPGSKTLVTFPLAGHENYLTKYNDAWTSSVAEFLQKEKTVYFN